MPDYTLENNLLDSVNNVAVKGAQAGKRYTDQETARVTAELKNEFSALTGTNKETIDAIISILDEADLQTDGSIDIVKFHQSLVAQIATNKAAADVNSQAVGAALDKVNTEIMARELLESNTSISINNIRQDIASALGLIEDVKQLALSNQAAIRKVGAGFSAVANAIDGVYGFTAVSNAL